MTSHWIFHMIFFATFSVGTNVVGQNTENIRIPNTGEGCNVINLNIGQCENAGNVRGPQGPQGKRGIAGVPGIKGSKGQKGEVGPQGIPAEINMADIISSVLKASAVTSCKALVEDHGISEAGYYLMRTNKTEFSTYKYCDFERRGVSTCEELSRRFGGNLTPGYYLLRGDNNFVYCHGPTSCQDVVQSAAKISLPSGGVFDIYSGSLRGNIQVTCNLVTDGGGWTVFQRRMDGSVSFYRTWIEYVNGFGDKDGEFWLGLETIYQMTKDGSYELRIDLTDWYGNTAYAKYGRFSISSREDNYRLHLSDYSGTAGDSLAIRGNNKQFSTKDADHDTWNRHCAQEYKGAWWYHGCMDSNLNGIYHRGHGSGTNGNHWYSWKNGWVYLKATEMKFRKK